MHLEVQVALNFVISYLFNKLPRRRVNLFGEELEKALKQKFHGHWYPDKPFKGSAFRCLRVSSPIDPVLEQAARESGMEVADVREHLPNELSVWIDPGEVSYRIGEKGAVKILYSESDSAEDSPGATENDTARSFNPEAQCFKPVDNLTSSLGHLSLSTTALNNGDNTVNGSTEPGTAPASPGSNSGGNASPSSNGGGFKTNNGANLIQAFIPKATAPVTFTTASFAQTKFGSTKLKSSGKRSHRLSPTEFSNYIKQRALQQQLQGSPNLPMTSGTPSPRFRGSSPQPLHQRPRSLSPKPQLDPFLMMAAVAPPCGPKGLFEGYLGEMGGPFPEGPFFGPATNVAENPKTFLEGMTLNSLPYSARYQHLLVAN